MKHDRKYIRDPVWQEHLYLIAQLYVDEDLKYKEIRLRLAKEGFETSVPAIKSRLRKWNIKKYKKGDELAMIARGFLKAKKQGIEVKIKRLGKDYPLDDVRAYLDKHPDISPSDEPLPEYLEIIECSTPMPEPSLEGSSHALVQQYDQNSLDGNSHIHSPMSECAGMQSTQTTTAAATCSNAADVLDDEVENEQKGVSDDYNLRTQVTDHGHLLHASQLSFEVSKTIRSLQYLISIPDLLDSEGTKALKHASEHLAHIFSRQHVSQLTMERTNFGPLHLAVNCNQLTCAKKLLRHGADINARGGLKRTPLHLAAMFGHFDLLDLFLQQKNVNVSAVDANGATPLLYAIPGDPSKWKSQDQNSSLKCALLLSRKVTNADPGILNGKTALHLACALEGVYELVRTILARTTILNVQDQEGSTAVHIALQHGNEGYVSTLIEAGAELNLVDRMGRTSMHVAAQHASTELLSEMLQKDVDCTIKSSDGETVLHILCRRGLYTVATAVAERPGVDVNARSRDGRTPLIIAASHGQLKTVKMLVRRNADTWVADGEFDTALKAAIRKGYEKIVDFLIDKSPLEPMHESVDNWSKQLEHGSGVERAWSMSTGRTLSDATRPHVSQNYGLSDNPQPSTAQRPYAGLNVEPSETGTGTFFSNNKRSSTIPPSMPGSVFEQPSARNANLGSTTHQVDSLPYPTDDTDAMMHNAATGLHEGMSFPMLHDMANEMPQPIVYADEDELVPFSCFPLYDWSDNGHGHDTAEVIQRNIHSR